MRMYPLVVKVDLSSMFNDPVNHPSHYTRGDIEVIDAIEGMELGFHEGQVVKYVARWRYKDNNVEDLKKAAWYLSRLIAREEKKYPAKIK